MHYDDVISTCERLADHLVHENALMQSNNFEDLSLLANDKEIVSRLFQSAKIFMMETSNWVESLSEQEVSRLKEVIEKVKVEALENEKQLSKLFKVSQKLLRSVTQTLQSKNQLTETYTALGTRKKNTSYAAPTIPAVAYNQAY
jgi:dsDNA-binding SOS-regulon protein